MRNVQRSGGAEGRLRDKANFALLPCNKSKGGKLHPLWDVFLAKGKSDLPFCQEPLMCVTTLG
jgi:hypothetical protein